MTRKSIVISKPYNFRTKSFKDVVSEGQIDLKQFISKEWVQLFKEAGIKKSQLKDPMVLLEIFKTCYGYMGTTSNIDLFKQKPPITSKLDDGDCCNDSCAICLDDINDKDSVWVCSLCNGILHNECIQEWSNKTPSVYKWNCPMCRNESDHLKSSDPKLFYNKDSPNRFIIQSFDQSNNINNNKISKFTKLRNSIMFKKNKD